jgi:hypothetical protein
MYETVRLRTVAAVPRVQAAVQASAATRQIEVLVIGIFWLLFLEGALRKWVAPEYSRLLFFVRDPLVLLLYWKAWRMGAFRNPSPFLTAGLGFAVLALLLAFAQSVTFGDTRIFAVVVYGWRQYFLYLPLPFAMAATLNQASVYRFVRHAFAAIVIMAPLVFIQFSSPPSAVINRGIADEEALQFQSFSFTGGGVRPSGPFTSTVGVAHMIPSVFALLLAMWMTAPQLRKMKMPVLVVAGAALATCLAMSGSRAAFVHLGIVVLFSLLLGLVSRDATVRSRALLLPILFVGLGIILFPIVFPEAIAAMLNRVAEAHASEATVTSLGIFGRALYETVDFTHYMRDTPLLGYGLGLGGNGRTYLGAAEAVALVPYAESDWSRHIVDLGPIVGLLFIVYRLVFTASVFAQAVRATRLSSNPFPMLLFGYLGIGFFYGQITGHGTVGGFMWLYLGLCLASCRAAVQGK